MAIGSVINTATLTQTFDDEFNSFSASPNGATGTVALGLTRQAFAIVGAKLYVPHAVEAAGAATDPDTGLSIRKVKAWDPVRSMQVNRMDSLFGLGNLYQDSGAVVVAGA